jgi:hypothetical protein
MERKLSDADVAVIVDALEKRALERLQVNVGRGVLSLVTTWALRAIVVLAAYGAGSGMFKKLGL